MDDDDQAELPSDPEDDAPDSGGDSEQDEQAVRESTDQLDTGGTR